MGGDRIPDSSPRKDSQEHMLQGVPAPEPVPSWLVEERNVETAEGEWKSCCVACWMINIISFF